MRICLTDPPGSILAEGFLTGLIREQDTPFPCIVIAMQVKGATEGLPAEITLDESALSTIVEAARKSDIQKIRDIVR